MMEHVHGKEDDQAKERLTRYFFSEEVWDTLPDKTRASLIDADRTWFSTTVGRVESTVNDLRIAAETLLYPLLWEPLPNHDKTEWFNMLDTKFNGPVEEYEPTLGNYINLLSDRNVLESIGLDGDFVKELRQGLKDLQPKRNPAEHHPKHSFTRSGIQGVVQKFFGIRQEGILPRLAKLYSKRVAGRLERSA